MPGTNDIVWQALATHQARIAGTRMTDWFAQDPGRASRYRLTAAGLTLDYSKNLITDETLNLFSRLIDANALPHRIQLMFEGERVNVSERRRALHTLLRTRPNKIPNGLSTEGEAIAETLSRIERIASDVRSGAWTGAGGEKISSIIHIGIGGSYLGPRMVTEALTPYVHKDLECHFIANVDGQHIDQLLKRLVPTRTLVIVASKTFTTQETMMNADAARQWLTSKMSVEDLAQHLIAVSENVEAASAFGVAEENILPMWDWVGGRYSVWSAVGLPVAIACGFKAFQSLLEGAHAMDVHFEDAPWPENMPMMLALLGVWYHNFHGAQSHAVLPYDHNLRLLPAHLQQLDMESSGKSVTAEGNPINWDTGPIIWGGEGTNGQHAFHQLLHQGTRFVGVDFIVPMKPHHTRMEHHHWLVANCFAQSRALMVGRSLAQIDGDLGNKPHRVMAGNRPSNTILMDKLTPEALGALIALYEHKVFCQALIWHINPFDQWGVELGKQLGESIHQSITNDSTDTTTDASTKQLIEHYRSRLKK